MPYTSPIMKTSLELFVHAIEHYVAGTQKDYRVAVLHSAHCIELAIKAVLVKRNHSIYVKEGKTITIHDGLKELVKQWNVTNLPFSSRVELLIDERNSIQHRYGTIDNITMDYHLETVFGFIGELLQKEFTTDIFEHIRKTLHKDIWSNCRFVKNQQEQSLEKAISSANEDPVIALRDAVEVLERFTKERINNIGLDKEPANILDLIMKFLANLPSGASFSSEEIPEIPKIFSLRNNIVHTGYQPTKSEVLNAIKKIKDIILDISNEQYKEIFKKALVASSNMLRGTDLSSINL